MDRQYRGDASGARRWAGRRRGGAGGSRVAWALLATAAAWPCTGQAAELASLADLSIEELADVQITSVSRRSERLAEAAASVYVITAEALQRAGATSLPQALRLAPNLQVAQVDAGQYAISARGFNNAIGNKLLVLIDGRTVYTPFFSGVFWDQQDLLLEDVERIEVISGPGATLWGANAVNGVINVITKAAGQTQGTLLLAAGGNREQVLGARYGGTVGPGHFRLYAKRSVVQNTRDAAGTPKPDGRERTQVGWRSDWRVDRDAFMLEGGAYRGESDVTSAGALPLGPIETEGAHLLARWTRDWADGANLRVQAYYDHTRRDEPLLYRPEENVADVELQHALPWGVHRLVWGGGYRQAQDRLRPGLFFAFVPERRTSDWYNVFLQDQLALTPSLDLTLGAKLEHNDFTGTEPLPTARLAWKAGDDQLLWAAWSRAVRSPARLDRDIRFPAQPLPGYGYYIAGGPGFVAEVANVTELGWRGRLGHDVTASLTLFHHRWDRLRSGQTPPNAQVQNMIEGRTFGAEGWVGWQVARHWRLSGGFTALRELLHVKPGSSDPTGASALGNDPDLQASLRSTHELAPDHELELGVRRVGALPEPKVPGYTAVDLRYGWQVRPGCTLSLVGLNLFDPRHVEYGGTLGVSEIPRSVQLQARWSL
jgi:iron complex outermembrane receptor protein